MDRVSANANKNVIAIAITLSSIIHRGMIEPCLLIRSFMLSYQHAYHIGNHADIIKHLILQSVLQKLQQKAKPFTCIDTHAGEGVYAVNTDPSPQHNEYQTGVAPLLQGDFDSELLNTWQAQLHAHFAKGQLPGSPWYIAMAMRETDQAHLVELHPQAYEALTHNIDLPNLHTYCEDSFKALRRLVPPLHRRGMVLIDPPYEDRFEYQLVSEAVTQALQKWATASFLVWYPLLSQRSKQKSGLSEQMVSELSTSECKSVADFRLTIATKDTADIGMYGSGMLCINLPYGCFEAIRDALQELVSTLGQNVNISATWLREPD